LKLKPDEPIRRFLLHALFDGAAQPDLTLAEIPQRLGSCHCGRDRSDLAVAQNLAPKAAERTVWQRIGGLLDRFSPQVCANHIKTAGSALLKRKMLDPRSSA
jgi:hypothetical protein